MTNDEKSKRIAEQAMAKIYAILNRPSCEVCWWESLTKGEKLTLTRHAGLDRGIRKKSWEQIPPSQRGRILNAAICASKWASILIVKLEANRCIT